MATDDPGRWDDHQSPRRWDRDDGPDDRRRDDPPYYERPDRGGLILAFGIVSLVTFQCFIGLVFGVLAWFWGTADLRAMDQGEMDPAGRSLTQAGRICGIIGAALGGFYLMIFGLYFVFVIVMIAGAAAKAPGGPPPPVMAPNAQPFK